MTNRLSSFPSEKDHRIALPAKPDVFKNAVIDMFSPPILNQNFPRLPKNDRQPRKKEYLRNKTGHYGGNLQMFEKK